MKGNSTLCLLYLILLGALSVGLSYYFGNDGIEAFLIALFGLIILFHTQIVLVTRAYSRQYGRIAGVLSVLFILTLWLGLVFGLSLFTFTYLPGIVAEIGKQINWSIVLLGSLPYGLPRLLKNENNSAQFLSVNLLVTTYSLLASMIALVVAEDQFKDGFSIALVLVVEVQVILAFIYSRTKYVEIVFKNVRGYSDSNSIGRDDIAAYAACALIGIPLFIPIVLLMVIIGL